MKQQENQQLVFYDRWTMKNYKMSIHFVNNQIKKIFLRTMVLWKHWIHHGEVIHCKWSGVFIFQEHAFVNFLVHLFTQMNLFVLSVQYTKTSTSRRWENTWINSSTIRQAIGYLLNKREPYNQDLFSMKWVRISVLKHDHIGVSCFKLGDDMEYLRSLVYNPVTVNRFPETISERITQYVHV